MHTLTVGVAKHKGLSAEIEKLPGKSYAYYFQGGHEDLRCCRVDVFLLR